MENIGDDQQCESAELSANFPEPEAKTNEYQIYPTEWQGIPLEIHHCPNWLNSHGEMTIQHIEIRSEGKVALPVTETGYLSHFMNGADALGEFNDDPVEFVFWWLEQAAKSKEWLAKVEAGRQYSLF
jgi:hypothetical protein